MTIRVIEHGSGEYEHAIGLRREILRHPLGLDFTAAELLDEASDVHLAAFDGDHLIATLVMSPVEPGVEKMRQVAVSPKWRGSGVGRAIVEASEGKAAEIGARRLILSAREEAVPFYLKLGYELEGIPFNEVGIPHRHMWKAIRPRKL